MAEAKKSTKKSEGDSEEKMSSDVEVQAEAVTGRNFGEVQSGILGGPSQDDLNPAYARPNDPNNDEDDSPNKPNPEAPN